MTVLLATLGTKAAAAAETAVVADPEMAAVVAEMAAARAEVVNN
jgi:hypothetical protein